MRVGSEIRPLPVTVPLLLALTIITLTSASSYQHHGEKGQSLRGVEDYEQDWGRVFRLVSISGIATLASMGNIFTISAIIMDDLLRKKGKVPPSFFSGGCGCGCLSIILRASDPLLILFMT